MNNILQEKLGNLAQLKLGGLVDILKQDGRYGVGKKFVQARPYYQPGNTSEIIDVGELKGGIKGLRKAYRDAGNKIENNTIAAFAVYLNNQAVAFGLYDADKLAGRTREGMFAYDLSQFKQQIEAEYEKRTADIPTWRKPGKMVTKTAYDKTKHDYENWSSNELKMVTRKFAGGSTSTQDLANFLDVLHNIAEQIEGKVTLKLVTADRAGHNRSQDRRINRPEEFDPRIERLRAAADLKKRLVRFKNAKRPTAENIQQFLELVTKKAAGVVNFSGKSWQTSPEKAGTYEVIDPTDLLRGKPFVINYRSAEPGAYDSLKISYRYDPKTNLVRPWQASWYAQGHREQTEIMDPEYWLQSTLKINDLDKPTVIKNMLSRMKDSPNESTYRVLEKSIKALRDMGLDWPELAVIEKSINAERNKNNS